MNLISFKVAFPSGTKYAVPYWGVKRVIYLIKQKLFILGHMRYKGTVSIRPIDAGLGDIYTRLENLDLVTSWYCERSSSPIRTELGTSQGTLHRAYILSTIPNNKDTR